MSSRSGNGDFLPGDIFESNLPQWQGELISELGGTAVAGVPASPGSQPTGESETSAVVYPTSRPPKQRINIPNLPKINWSAFGLLKQRPANLRTSVSVVAPIVVGVGGWWVDAFTTLHFVDQLPVFGPIARQWEIGLWIYLAFQSVFLTAQMPSIRHLFHPQHSGKTIFWLALAMMQVTTTLLYATLPFLKLCNLTGIGVTVLGTVLALALALVPELLISNYIKLFFKGLRPR